MTNHGSWRPNWLTPFLRHVHPSPFVRSVSHEQYFSRKPQILDTFAEIPLDVKDNLVSRPVNGYTAVQGAEHWETLNARWALDAERKVAALPAEERASWRKASQTLNEAKQLRANGQYAQAEPLFLEYRRLCENVLGQKHPWTAASCNQLGVTLYDLGRYAEALSLNQKALDVNLELLGEKHPNTVTCYGCVAHGLKMHGQFAEAQPLFQKALELRLELFGEKHPDTAHSYIDLASNLGAQGKYAEALAFAEKALRLRLELLGENHSDIAVAYATLALVLNGQCKYADAQPLFKKALELRLKLLGDVTVHGAGD